MTKHLNLDKIKTILKGALFADKAIQLFYPNIVERTRVIPENAKESAVFMLLCEINKEWNILAIQRTTDGKAHSAQIGFPGGRKEIDDINLLETAYRETFEEIGISSNKIQLLGQLSTVYIDVSNFNVTPFLGIIHENDLKFTISEDEVAAIFFYPLQQLFAPNGKQIIEVYPPILKGISKKVNAYSIENKPIIWGASAIMLAELEITLQQSSFIDS
jgi:8-oxo-dGTP pyrophosphatase MutT (NUDIX family)